MRFRGGEFSTGTTGNSHPELTRFSRPRDGPCSNETYPAWVTSWILAHPPFNPAFAHEFQRHTRRQIHAGEVLQVDSHVLAAIAS